MRTDGLCCLSAHANAKAPWTCQCDCHKRPQELPGLTREEVRILDAYNAEVDRGIVHTNEWAQQMEELQKRFDS